jgi:hypothetical protein
MPGMAAAQALRVGAALRITETLRFDSSRRVSKSPACRRPAQVFAGFTKLVHIRSLCEGLEAIA